MYYVYVYLDPRKPGIYNYNDLSFNFEPFYIGKGKNNRDKNHLNLIKNWKRGTNSFYDKLNKLITLKINPIIIKILEGLDEKESLIEEVKFIELIGRKDLGEGPLLNMTNGGIGGDTYSNLTEEQKLERGNKQRISMIGKNKKPMSQETKDKLSKKFKGRKCPEHSKRMKSRILTDDQKKKARAGVIKSYENPDRKTNAKKIIQKDLKGEVIKIWNSLEETKSEFGNFSPTTICNVCKNGAKYKTGYGFKWEYYNE